MCRTLIDGRNWLARRDYVDSNRIAVMGLWMGGGFAVLLGKTGLLQVSAPFYGQVPEPLEDYSTWKQCFPMQIPSQPISTGVLL